MQALKIMFTGLDQVQVREERVSEPEPGEVLVQTRKTLISTGTECICLGRQFDPGSEWDAACVYPKGGAYSLVGHIVAAGHDVRAANGPPFLCPSEP